MSKNWIEYWNQDGAMSGPVWQAYTEYFIKEFTEEFSLTPDDVLLDIGCGNGRITASLAKFVHKAYGADTSANCLEQANSSYAAGDKLSFFQLAPDNYLALDSLPIAPPTYIICVSIVQYYRSLDELRTLIASCKKIAAPGGRLVLVDLLIDHKPLKDALGVLLGAFKTGTFLLRLREIFAGAYSSYTETRASNHLLSMTRKQLEDICALEGVKLKFIKRDFVGTSFRPSALIELSQI
jgi:SAM-dependent methyltransferase